MNRLADLAKLKKRLLNIGGKRFQFDWVLLDQITSDEMSLLLEQGVMTRGYGARTKKMRSRACHENSAMLATLNGWTMWSGLALSPDDIWRVHSWAVNKRGRIVETTIWRTTYFGIPLNNGQVADKYLAFATLVRAKRPIASGTKRT